MIVVPIGGGDRADARVSALVGACARRAEGDDGAGGHARRSWTRWPSGWLRDAGATPAFKGYHGYPATICASVNDAGDSRHPVATRPLRRRRRHLDRRRAPSWTATSATRAVTVPVGQVSPDAARLLQRHRGVALARRLQRCGPAARVSDIGRAVQQHVESARVFGGARVRRARHRAAAARRAAGAELRRAGPRAAAAPRAWCWRLSRW